MSCIPIVRGQVKPCIHKNKLGNLTIVEVTTITKNGRTVTYECFQCGVDIRDLVLNDCGVSLR